MTKKKQVAKRLSDFQLTHVTFKEYICIPFWSLLNSYPYSEEHKERKKQKTQEAHGPHRSLEKKVQIIKHI